MPAHLGQSPDWTAQTAPQSPPLEVQHPQPEGFTQLPPHPSVLANAPTGYPRLRLIVVTLLGLAETVVPTLGLYRPIATGILFIARLTPVLLWSLPSALAPWNSGGVTRTAEWGHDT